MRIVIAAAGRLKPGPEKALLDEYLGRLTWPVALREIEARPGSRAETMTREGELLLGALEGPGKRGGRRAAPASRRLVALDERGEMLTSEALAQRLGTWRDQGVEEIGFAIGGADGLDEAVRGRADLLLAFGRLTWPHLLVRALLAEQLYRAQQILAGHPYHRA